MDAGSDLNTKLVGFMLSILILTMFIFCQNNNVYAHKFYNNQASILYSLIKRYEVENNLAAEKVTTNKSLALKHSENADNLLKQLVTLDKEVVNSSKFIKNYKTIFNGLNLTTKALVAANLADEALRQYGLAKGLDSKTSSSLLNMSMGMIMKMNKFPRMNMTDGISGKSSDSMPSMPSINQSSNSLLKLRDNNVTNEANYESSTNLAKSLKMLYSSNLENTDLQNSIGLMRIPMNMKIESVKELGQGINNLVSALNGNASLDEVYSIVHGQIHPNLFLAFDLKLKGE